MNLRAIRVAVYRNGCFVMEYPIVRTAMMKSIVLKTNCVVQIRSGNFAFCKCWPSNNHLTFFFLFLRCRSDGVCLSIDKHCNGVSNCVDGSDEEDCKKQTDK